MPLRRSVPVPRSRRCRRAGAPGIGFTVGSHEPGTAKACALGRMCPIVARGSTQKGRDPARPTPQGGDGQVAQPLRSLERGTTGAGGRGDRHDQVRPSTHRRHQARPVLGEEGGEELTDASGEPPARLVHRRLLVAHQDRVERPRNRAQVRRQHRGQRQLEQARQRAAGEAVGEAAGGPAADEAGRRRRRPASTQVRGVASSRCRRKVPVARLTSAPSWSRIAASP